MSNEDEDMSNALMSDMADALRSAGLGSMVGQEAPDEFNEDASEEPLPEPTPEPSAPRPAK